MALSQPSNQLKEMFISASRTFQIISSKAKELGLLDEKLDECLQSLKSQKFLDDASAVLQMTGAIAKTAGLFMVLTSHFLEDNAAKKCADVGETFWKTGTVVKAGTSILNILKEKWQEEWKSNQLEFVQTANFMIEELGDFNKTIEDMRRIIRYASPAGQRRILERMRRDLPIPLHRNADHVINVVSGDERYSILLDFAMSCNNLEDRSSYMQLTREAMDFNFMDVARLRGNGSKLTVAANSIHHGVREIDDLLDGLQTLTGEDLTPIQENLEKISQETKKFLPLVEFIDNIY